MKKNLTYSLHMLTTLLAATVYAMPVMAQDAPSTNIAWTQAEIRFVAQGDIQRGKELNQRAYCVSCHGETGISPSANWPSLAGQRAEYTFKMLKDYQDKKRTGTAHNQLMYMATQQLNDQDMADLARFYASQPLPKLPSGITYDVDKAKAASNLIVRGDGMRFIAPCQSCHGIKGEGAITDTPALAGMPPDYFIATMKEYRNGTRHNDVYARMRLITKELTDVEIENLAHYYAGLTAK